MILTADEVRATWARLAYRRVLDRDSAVFARLYAIAPLCFEPRTGIAPLSTETKINMLGAALDLEWCAR